MVGAFATGALTGMGFGVVLYKVGASRYSRVMGMVTLRDTKIMKFAFTAIATASLLYGAAGALGVAERFNLVPRVMPFLGWAHLLGGVLFGAAMGVSGLCPGTCAAKFGGSGGNRRFANTSAVLGLVVGVLLYGWLKEPLTSSGVIAAQQKPLTLHGVLGLPYPVVALALGALLLAVVLVVDRVTNEKRYAPSRERRSLLDYVRGEWSFVGAGMAAGVLVVLATAQSGYLGFSGAILAAVGWAAQLVGHPMEIVPRITDDIAWRAALILGVFPGGLLAAALSIKSKAATEEPAAPVLDLGWNARTFTAVTTMTLGALIGGGCTTGAFIAGWPTLSLGSLAMAGTFFVVALAVGNARLMAFHTLDLVEAQRLGDRAYD